MEKVPWDVGRDGVVVRGLVGRCEGKGKGRRKNVFGGVYAVYCIRSLIRGHSPGGATVLLCLICFSTI